MTASPPDSNGRARLSGPCRHLCDLSVFAILIASAVLFAYHGQPCILMCDPLQLTDETLIIPQ